MQENKNENNIFEYATKELSQDAVICWLLNWIKFPESKLFELSKEVFALIGEQNIDADQTITIKTQVKKADIVVVLHGQRKIIIIEDKTFTSEHDDQIKRYKELLCHEENKRSLEISSEFELYSISTVYFKTGFYYDEDTLVDADICVTGESFYKVISKYYRKTDSEILDSYIKHLEGILKYYDTHKDFCKRYSDGGYYVSWEYIAQYSLMRTFFGEEKWNKETNEFKIYSGSSYGRPWTETYILPELIYPDSDDKYYLFWRIDTDNDGPYISLRFYESFNKNDSNMKERHRGYYESFVDMIRGLFENNYKLSLKWDDVKDGYKGNYKESSLITIHLSSYLDDWQNKREILIEDIRSITAGMRKQIISSN